MSEETIDKILEYTGKNPDDLENHDKKKTYLVKRISDLSFEDKKKIVDSPDVRKYLKSVKDYLDHNPREIVNAKYGKKETKAANLAAAGGVPSAIAGMYGMGLGALAGETALFAAGSVITGLTFPVFIGGLIASICIAIKKRREFKKLNIEKSEKLDIANRDLNDIKLNVEHDVIKVLKLKRIKKNRV